MSEEKLTLGQAIDQIITALSKIDDASQAVALDAVCRHLKIQFSVKDIKAPPLGDALVFSQSPVQPAAAAPQEQNRGKGHRDIRSLKDEKQPKSAQQMACIVAYYLGEIAPEHERKDMISSADLEKYFKQAGFKLPEDITQVLKNGKKGGYFDSADRGHYKLNAVGYNLVAHNLPAKSE